MRGVSRRGFVTGLGATLLPFTLPRAVAAQTRQRVVVVGAGLAGLVAAYELQQAGFEAVVLEQSNRVGGRIKTVRDHFADGAWVDVGGQTSGGGYANFFYYSTTFGLEFEPQSVANGGARPDVLVHLNEKLHSLAKLRATPDDWPLALHAEERAQAPTRLLSYYLSPIAKEVGPIANVLDPEFIGYDQLTLAELLRQRGASDAAIRLIDHTLNYNSVDTVSALSAIRDATRAIQLGRAGPGLNLIGGNASLPEAFATKLGESIHRNCEVQAIDYSGAEIQLSVRTKDEVAMLNADRVVLAVPFTALRKIQATPAWPEERSEIIQQLPYTQIAQLYLQTRTRFWETDGPTAMVVSDGPLERLFNASSRLQGDRGLLVNWVNGDSGTEEINAQSADEHLETVLSEIESIWPGSRDQVEVSYAQNWSNSYVGGAYAHYAPGQMTQHAASLAKPIDRVHFAGEHTELVAPGMEGALTSGKRAAGEIINENA